MTNGPARGNPSPSAEALSIRELSIWAPTLPSILGLMGIQVEGNEEASLAYICEEAGIDPEDIFLNLSLPEPLNEPRVMEPGSLDIVSGKDKDGNPESISRLKIMRGEVIAIVGPTGSGKTQLLADIETLAQGDSPSGRVILLDGEPPPESLRWSAAIRATARISQSMNFLLDLTVSDFLAMHAACRGVDELSDFKERTVEAACTLCGEPFSLKTQIVSLSGGQSRALMIADAILISRAPIILVDEIENAGINREKAMRFLLGQGKISFIATHDPLLALQADKRIILANGAMKMLLDVSDNELSVLSWLNRREKENVSLRNQLRSGKRLVAPRVRKQRAER